MESQEQAIRRLRQELKQKDGELSKKDKALEQKDRKLEQKDRKLEQKDKTINSLRSAIDGEETLWDASAGTSRAGISPVLLHSRELIHGILEDPARLKKVTGRDPDEFKHVLDGFTARSKEKNSRLFAEDGRPDPGNRCLLERRSALLLTMMRKRSGATQDMLSVIFDIDQAAVSRYLGYADPILKDILPTGPRLNERIKKAGPEELEILIPGRTIIVDGTEVPRQRPQDGEERKNTYSGKKKRFTYNTTIVTNRNGLILSVGRTFEGGTHDLTMITEDPIDFGRHSKGMHKKDTPQDQRFTVLADKGYLGLDKACPGINLVMPKKKPKGGRLTPREKQRNKKTSGRRITVEHSIGRIKQWGIMRGPYDGTLEEFQDELVVATGLANLGLLWDKKRRRPKIDYRCPDEQCMMHRNGAHGYAD